MSSRRMSDNCAAANDSRHGAPRDRASFLEGVLPRAPAKFLSANKSVYCPSRHSTIDLSLTHNPLGCSPRLEAMSAGGAERLSRYPELGFKELCGTLAAKLRLEPNSVCLGSGIDDILEDLVTTFAEDGDEIVLPAHTFPNIAYFAEIRGVRAVRASMCENLRVDFRKMRDCVSDRTRIVYLCNPNNPTGLVEEVSEIARLASGLNCLMVVDEANIEYDGDSCVAALDHHPNMLVMRTFSKAYGLAGARIGYCLGAPELIRYIEGCRPPFVTSAMAAELAREALLDADHVRRSVDYMQEQTAFLSRELTLRNFLVTPARSNCFVCRVPLEFGSANNFQRLLAPFGVAVVNGRHFSLPDDYIRVAPQSRDLNIGFVTAIDSAR